MHEPPARHGQVGLHPVQVPVGIGQQRRVPAEDRLLIEQPGLPDALVHPLVRLPGPEHPVHNAVSRAPPCRREVAGRQSRTATSLPSRTLLPLLLAGAFVLTGRLSRGNAVAGIAVFALAGPGGSARAAADDQFR